MAFPYIHYIIDIIEHHFLYLLHYTWSSSFCCFPYVTMLFQYSIRFDKMIIKLCFFCYFEIWIWYLLIKIAYFVVRGKNDWDNIISIHLFWFWCFISYLVLLIGFCRSILWVLCIKEVLTITNFKHFLSFSSKVSSF